MPFIPDSQALILAAILFTLGLIVVLVRRNLIFILIGIEIMFNATGLAFVAAGMHWGQADGQIMFILILAAAASAVAVGLALLLRMYHRFETLDVDSASEMRG